MPYGCEGRIGRGGNFVETGGIGAQGERWYDMGDVVSNDGRTLGERDQREPIGRQVGDWTRTTATTRTYDRAVERLHRSELRVVARPFGQPRQ